MILFCDSWNARPIGVRHGGWIQVQLLFWATAWSELTFTSKNNYLLVNLHRDSTPLYKVSITSQYVLKKFSKICLLKSYHNQILLLTLLSSRTPPLITQSSSIPRITFRLKSSMAFANSVEPQTTLLQVSLPILLV